MYKLKHWFGGSLTLREYDSQVTEVMTMGILIPNMISSTKPIYALIIMPSGLRTIHVYVIW